MDSLNLEQLWELMSQYNFEVDSKVSDEDVICSLCKKLMIDACHSVCGCQYCYKCIRDFLLNGNDYCPGDGTKCREEPLILDKDIVRDRRTNNKIMKMKMKCPNDLCKCAMELSEMSCHLRVCSQSVQCPYVSIGCDGEGASEDSIMTHLNREKLTHAQLLFECITNLKNDIGGLKDVIHMMKEEMASIREDSNQKNNRIIVLEEELERLKCQSDGEIEPKIIETQAGAQASAMGTSSYHLLDMPHNDVDFIWTIKDCTKKRGSSIFSDSFYSNGYKLCLCFFLYGDSIGLNCVLMPGENDDKLQWPMMREVRLAIVDQKTLEPHKSASFHYSTFINKSAFSRPKMDRSNFIGMNPFIMYSDMKDVPSLIANDSIIVSCVLSPASSLSSF